MKNLNLKSIGIGLATSALLSGVLFFLSMMFVWTPYSETIIGTDLTGVNLKSIYASAPLLTTLFLLLALLGHWVSGYLTAQLAVGREIFNARVLALIQIVFIAFSIFGDNSGAITKILVFFVTTLLVWFLTNLGARHVKNRRSVKEV